MNKSLYDAAINFEKITQEIYEEILRKEGIENVEVMHNVKLKGKSDFEHQVDIYWKFRMAGVEHCVIVECKNYNSSVTVDKIKVLHDTAMDLDAKALIITKTGYQSGAVTLAESYKIGLKLLQRPVPSDWNGFLQKINLQVIAIMPYNMNIGLDAHPVSQEQLERIASYDHSKAIKQDKFLFDALGNPDSQALSVYVSAHLPQLIDGEGYSYEFEPENRYMQVLYPDFNAIEFLQVKKIKVSYSVRTIYDEFTIDAMEAIDFVLKDFLSGKVEHFYNSKS